MNRTEFIKALAPKVELSQKKTNEVICAAFDIIVEQVAAGESVDFVGFGSFKSHASSECIGCDPQTNEEIMIPTRIKPRFDPGQPFKDKVAGKK